MSPPVVWRLRLSCDRLAEAAIIVSGSIVSMKQLKIVGLAILASAGSATAAHANNIGAEANVARAEGHWGGELGAGYSFDLGAISVTPGAGLLFANDHTRLYGRIEAAVAIPAFAKVGAGLRISGDHTRPYATIAFPLVPKLAAKGNIGPKYYAVGLTLGY
jgi:hypothetical protein